MVTRVAQHFFSYKALFVVLLFSVVVAGCVKPRNVKWVSYNETRCADKWDYSPVNEKLKDNIIAYFNGQGVKILELEIYSDRTPDTCTDCNCKTGRRISCKVKKRDVSEMKSEQFYED